MRYLEIAILRDVQMIDINADPRLDKTASVSALSLIQIQPQATIDGTYDRYRHRPRRG